MANDETKFKTFLRVHGGMKVTAIAEESGVSETDCYRFHSGAIRPSDEDAQKIADALTRILKRPVLSDELFDIVPIRGEPNDK